jgi:hypothetical protein
MILIQNSFDEPRRTIPFGITSQRISGLSRRIPFRVNGATVAGEQPGRPTVPRLNDHDHPDVRPNSLLAQQANCTESIMCIKRFLNSSSDNYHYYTESFVNTRKQKSVSLFKGHNQFHWMISKSLMSTEMFENTIS